MLATGSVGLGQVTDDSGWICFCGMKLSRGWDERHSRVGLGEEFGVGIERSGFVFGCEVPHAARLLVGGGKDEMCGGVLALVGVLLWAVDFRRQSSKGLVRTGDGWDCSVGPSRDTLADDP